MMQTPKAILRILLVLAIFCIISALGGIVVAARGQQWYMLAFEVIVLITAVPCLLLALRPAAGGHAMAMFCLGGVVGVTAALIDPNLVKAIIQRQSPNLQPVGGVNILPWLLARFAVGGLLGVLSALSILIRRPAKSFPLLAKGILFGLPVAAAAAVVVIPSMRGKLIGLPPVGLIVLAIAGTVILGALISISGHLIIRAFAVGLEEPEPARS